MSFVRNVFSQQLCFSFSVNETQRLKKIFLPFHCPKEGLDPFQALGNVCTDASSGQIGSPVSANAACVMELRAGEDGEASSALAPARLALFSALELYQFTLRESESLACKLCWVRGTSRIRRENCVLVTCAGEIFPKPRAI